jgi:hypothetical protein
LRKEARVKKRNDSQGEYKCKNLCKFNEFTIQGRCFVGVNKMHNQTSLQITK